MRIFRMRARSLELSLVHSHAVGAADIAARNTELRKAVLLPSGGRGPHAPAIEPKDAAYMFTWTCERDGGRCREGGEVLWRIHQSRSTEGRKVD